VQDLTVVGNRVDGWTNTSDGGALKLRDAEDVVVSDNHFQTSGILAFTHFCAEDKAVTCTDQQVPHLLRVRIDRNRIDVPDEGLGAKNVRGISYWRTSVRPVKSTGPVCTGTGFEDIRITNNTFPRGGVVHVHCAEGAKVCVAGNTGAATTSWELTGPLATAGCAESASWDQPLAGVHRGDFNGDGKADFVWRVRAGSSATWRAHLSVGDGYADQDWGDGVRTGSDTRQLGMLVADFDGNGRDDLAYHALCGSPSTPCWRVQLSTGSGFMAPHNFGDGVTASDETLRYGFHTGDFNGDTRADIIFRGLCGSDRHPCWTVLASQPDTTFAAQDWGDGLRVDPARVNTYGVLVGDFDGDRRDDVVYFGRCGDSGTPCLRVHRATEAATFHVENWGDEIDLEEAPVDLSAQFGMRIGDVNGDGRADIGYRGKCGSLGVPQWRYHLGSTEGFTVFCRASAP
jgi:hypothetical protein